MEVIIAAIVGAMSTILLALIGVYGAKRAGLGTTQERLIADQKGIIDTQDRSLQLLKERVNAQDVKIYNLETKVQELTDLTVKQAILIRKLLSKRKVILNPDDEI